FKPEPAGGAEMVWYLVDWGDGTVTPTSHGKAAFSPLLSKVWRKPGRYTVKSHAITMSGKVDELMEHSVSVTGERFPEFPGFLASRRSGNPPSSRDPYFPQSIELHFEQVESIDALLLKKDTKAPFPDSFSIEVSTDRGTVWNDVPAAVYNHFPNPGGQTVWIPLHGLAANAIRVVSYNPPKISGKKHALRIGGLRAVGRDMLFEMDADPQTAADWNNMWLAYGSAVNEVSHHFSLWWPVDRPDEGGLLGIGSTIWAHWNSMKLSWLDDPVSKKYYETTVNTYPQDEQGLMGVAAGGFYHLDHSRHYVTPAIFISGMSHWYLMHRDGAFLETNDKKTGVALLEKTRKTMRYQLDDMDGGSGVLTIHDPEHDGTVNGMSGNYWDAWRFGYKSAYANMLFYQSLDWMERLETALGNLDEAAQYRTLRPLVKKRFNEVFWNEKTGRFIGCEGKDGSRHDYGFTFVNLEAVASGIATPEHAEQILQWLDGDRIVEGDTSTGADIYAWRVSPRANTLDAAAVAPSFWDSWTMETGPETIGEYGRQIQNGGHIFYVSYYDLMSRLKTRGIDDAMKRMEVILDEFHKDQLRRKPSNKFGSTHQEGILREFPESGLVPLFFVTGILGIEPAAGGLRIEPNLPDDWNFAAVNEYWFAGKKYCIRVERELAAPIVDDSRITVPAQGLWVFTPDGELNHAD
ncbi:MAG: hypothetical protein U9P12_07585, partial [Verrucomicrobiota bacterium]|nr:hypothetical protein [Verrucomicrobiota bacterium]